jgi:hypothetical protein
LSYGFRWEGFQRKSTPWCEEEPALASESHSRPPECVGKIAHGSHRPRPPSALRPESPHIKKEEQKMKYLKHWESLDRDHVLFIDKDGHRFIMKQVGEYLHDTYGVNDEIEIWFDCYQDEEGNFFVLTWHDVLEPIDPEYIKME